jgi:RimJ/RimL family protein N-acetyltransferase
MAAVTLRSGREVEVRPILPQDAVALAQAYDRLSPESKYQRFFALKPHLTAGDLHYLTEVDGHDHVALVATPPGEPDRILGVGRYVRLREDPTAAEFAITVGDPYQSEGLGTVLIEALADIAGEREIHRFTATMLADNIPAHRLLHRLAGRLPTERHRGSLDEIEVELAA